MMAETFRSNTKSLRAITARVPAIWWLAGMIAALPVLSGIMFRTYWYHVEPSWYESLRQFDFPFLPAELAVVFVAHHRGMRFRTYWEMLDRPAKVAAVLFLGTFWLSSAFVSEHPLYSLMRCFYWLTHIAFGCAIIHLVRTALAYNLRVLTFSLLAGLAAFVVLLAVHFLSAPDPQSVKGGRIIWSSAVPGCLSVRHLGIHAAAVLALAATTAIVTPERLIRRWCYVGVVLSAGVLFWSGTRAGAYGFAVAAAATVLMLGRKPRLAPAIPIVALLALAIPLSMLWLPRDPAFGIFSLAEFGSDLEDFGHGRWELWKLHWPLFLANPWFGHGDGATYWLMTIGDTNHVQPHNSIIQLVIGWGLIPSLFGAYLWARIWIVVGWAAAMRASAIPLVMMLNCLLVISLVDGALFFTRMTMLISTSVAVVLVSCYRSRVGKDEMEPPPNPQPAPPAPSAHLR